MDFVITDSGRTAAFNAGISGIKIEVTQFKLGSGVGYTPNSLTDTALHGTVLYTGVPTGFTVVDADECEFLLEVPGNIGTFNFGEIGLYLNNGELFALQALPALQQKIAFPGTGWNTIRIRARLMLVNISPVIQWVVQNLTIGAIQELPNYSFLSRPTVAPSNIYIVHQADENGNEALVTRSSGDTWDVNTHQFVPVKAGDFAIVSSTGASLVASGPLPIEQTFPVGRYLIQMKTGPLAGLIRQIQTVAGANVTWTPAFGSSPAPGDQFEILQSTCSIVVTEGSEQAFFHALSVRSVA